MIFKYTQLTTQEKRKRLTYLLFIQGGLALMLLIATLRSARAGFDVTVAGTGTLTNVRTTSSTGYTGKFAPGGGLLFGVPIGGSSQIELGGLLVSRKYDYTTTVLGVNLSNTVTLNMVEVPIVYRYWFNRSFGFGMGGYYGAYVGPALVDVTNSRTGTVTSAKTNYGNNGLKKKDAGLLASLALRLPLGAKASLLVDGRYSYGLLNNAQSGSAVHFDDLQGLLGLVFSL